MRPTPPIAGTIYSSDTDAELKIIIDNVSTPEADGFFLVSLGNASDHTSPRMELDGWEWDIMRDTYRLMPNASSADSSTTP